MSKIRTDEQQRHCEPTQQPLMESKRHLQLRSLCILGIPLSHGWGAGWTLHCRCFDPAHRERRRCTTLPSKQHLQRDKEEGAGAAYHFRGNS